MAPSQKAAPADQEVAAGDQKAFLDADTAIGSDVAQLAMPENISYCVAEARPIAAVKAPIGASKAVVLDVTDTSLQHIDARRWNNSRASASKHCRKQFIDNYSWHLSTDPHWWLDVSS